ncbi:TPA: hypothetical protein DEP21_03145 [Patescibacteria group bacterium]|nr:hypothetical protein [Candidatus Gracilibacteria bacterium]
MQWLHLSAPTKEEINSLINTYDFHELIEEDLLESSTHEKIDIYEEYMFIVLNFPKYNTQHQNYIFNEFSIILGKNIIVTMTKYDTNHIQNMIEEYTQELKEREEDEDYKISPYYILYRIIDAMYDKAGTIINKSTKDVLAMEHQLFSSSRLEKQLLESLTIKKRNIVFLKHIYIPHQEILEQLQNEIPKFYKEDLDVYFEDLSSRVDKIMNNIEKSHENIESLFDTYNTLMTIKTNSVINVLTIFSALT